MFQGVGGPTFSRRVQLLIPIETYIICDFVIFQGGLAPCPPSGSAHKEVGK